MSPTSYQTAPLRDIKLEAPTRFELVIKVLQTSALPLGYGALAHHWCIYIICSNMITVKLIQLDSKMTRKGIEPLLPP